MPDPYQNVCYKKNFLREVIARIDFLNPLYDLDSALPKGLSDAALRIFPITEPREAVEKEISLTPEGIASSEQRIKQWEFHGKDRNKKVTIGRQVFLVSYKHYQTYELLRSEFMTVFERLLDEFEGQVQPSRIGLRYVNAIETAEDASNPLDWAAYINPKLLCAFDFPAENDRKSVSRLITNFEVAFNDFSLRTILGMPNPDYPAPIRRKLFVLDFDAYTQTYVEPRGIGSLLDNFHESIQKYFELSITEGLRNKLNE